jgi:ATP-dependent DNA helicase RecG
LTEDYLSSLGINERQTRAVEYLKKNAKITNSDYQKINQVTKKTSSRDLLELVKREIILKKGNTGKGVFYNGTVVKIEKKEAQGH